MNTIIPWDITDYLQSEDDRQAYLDAVQDDAEMIDKARADCERARVRWDLTNEA